MLIDSCTRLDKISKVYFEDVACYALITEPIFSNWNRLLSIQNKRIFLVLGIQSTNIYPQNEDVEKVLNKLIVNHKVIAIGVIGLDYRKNKISRVTQKIIFEKQLDLAQRNNLPVIISCPEAFNDCYEILLKRIHQKKQVRGAFNYFSENEKQIKSIIDLGLFVSFSEKIINRKENRLQKIVSVVPQNRLLVRTGGEKNCKKDTNKIDKIIKEVAFLRKKVIPHDIARITSYNAISLFKLPIKFKDQYTYQIRNSLYINLTNRCTNVCDFCPRLKEPVVKGYYLKLRNEPTAKQIIKEIGDPKEYEEIVFCGYGEPTLRLKTVEKIAKYIKARGGKTRLNTNGHANIIAKRNVLPKMKGLFDVISISLNFHNKKLYLKHCKPIFGNKTWEGLIEFIICSKDVAKKVVVTAVDGCKDVDIARCKKIADILKVNFRGRTYYK